MQEPQINKPAKLNTDKSRKYLAADEAFYLLNHEVNSVLGKSTPLNANYPACDIQQPAGENYTQSYSSKLTKELYDWVYNSNGVHYIKRMNSKGVCEIVYGGDYLELSADPKHSIEQFRAFLAIDKRECFNIDGKQLIWCNGNGAIGQIDTEASIATNFFTTPFFDISPDPLAPIRMCVPDPCQCVHGDFADLSTSEEGLANNLIDTGVKIAYQHIYYDNRASIWSDPSTLYYQDTKGCFNTSRGLSRCLKLRIPIGNPLVDRIKIAFWKDGIWYLHETVEKYKKYNSTQEKWYQRKLSEQVQDTLNENDWTFEYKFCNDKQCEAIDPLEFNRVFNPMPINPQGLFNIGDALAFYNYIQGNCTLDKAIAEKFVISKTCDENKCQTEFVKVKVRAIVYNKVHGNQFIYRLEGSDGESDNTTFAAYFGGLNTSAVATNPDLETGYDQSFIDKTRNFIAYVEGTDIWGEMKQWKAHKFFTNREAWDVLAGLNDAATKRRWRRAINNREFFYQEVELKVPKGTRGFIRLSSHKSTGNDQDTSTFVSGTLGDIRGYAGKDDITGSIINEEEIYFDACNGDQDLFKCFVVEDNAVDNGIIDKASAYNGYIKDNNGIPVEGATVELDGESVSCRTDHNGFYHLYLFPGSDAAKTINVKVEKSCFGFTTEEAPAVLSEKGYNTKHDISIEDVDYPTTFRLKVRMLVKNCNGEAVSGIVVALSGSKYKTTGVNGYVEFYIRNYETRDRSVRAVVMNNKGCITADCVNACNPCMPTSTSSTLPCYYSSSSVVILNPAIINTSTASFLRNGLKKGGSYLMGFVLTGDCGIISAVNETTKIDIPRLQENDKLGFCQFSYNATGMVLPDKFTCLKIVRTENINPFELQWVVDKVERTTDSKIKLTIQSLNDYNERYFFRTNSVYKWLKGDRVEFIRNGNGTVFSIAANGLLNYLTVSPFLDENLIGDEEQEADFFNQLIIEDDGNLDSLLEGAIIELQRPKECVTKPTYFTICASIPIVDGKLLYETGTFTTFDTYLVRRQIGELQPQIFEHHSPSDFWGERITDVGKPHFPNKYESERRYGRNITVNNPNEFNRFGDFVKKLDPVTHGDIIAIGVADESIGLCISEQDNSLFEIGGDFLKVGGDGIVRAIPPDQLISDTQPKTSGKYGCQYESIGGIYFGDGYTMWADINNGYVKHDYRQAKLVDTGKMSFYFRNKFQLIKSINGAATDNLNKLRFATGFNCQNKSLHLTIKSLRQSGICNEKMYLVSQNETVRFNPISEEFLDFTSYTPEAYGELELEDESGCAFVVFLNGVPYIHPIIADKFNEFFGVAVDRVVGVSINKLPQKIKVALSFELEDDTMWYVHDVKTDAVNFRSEIPPVRIKKSIRKWNASFLGNINSRGGLFNGEAPRGYHVDVVFVRDNTDGLKYGTTDSAKRIKYDELDLILFKFLMSEQSGFENNL